MIGRSLQQGAGLGEAPGIRKSLAHRLRLGSGSRSGGSGGGGRTFGGGDGLVVLLVLGVEVSRGRWAQSQRLVLLEAAEELGLEGGGVLVWAGDV